MRSSSKETSARWRGITSTVLVFVWRPGIVACTSYAFAGRSASSAGATSASGSPSSANSAPRGLLTISNVPKAGAKPASTRRSSFRSNRTRVAAASRKRCSKRTTTSPGRTAWRSGVSPTGCPSMNTCAAVGSECRSSVAEPSTRRGPMPSENQSAAPTNANAPAASSHRNTGNSRCRRLAVRGFSTKRFRRWRLACGPRWGSSLETGGRPSAGIAGIPFACLRRLRSAILTHINRTFARRRHERL